VGLSACPDFFPDRELAQYKANAKTTLQAYAIDKGECNYCEDNWAEIEQIVIDGKKAINAAKDKDGVDSVFIMAKADIDAIEKKEEVRGLAEHITTAKSILETYTLDKGQDNYTATKWVIINELVATGIIAINAAMNMAEIDSALNKTKLAIDAVEQKDGMITPYSMREAFDAGYLTREDLKHIAYFLMSEVFEVEGIWHDETFGAYATVKDTMTRVDFTPFVLQSLDSQTTNELKQAYYKSNLCLFLCHNVGIEKGITAFDYLGSYNDSSVVHMRLSFVDGIINHYYVVAGIVFPYRSSYFVTVFVRT
jgi:hypothetical protein